MWYSDLLTVASASLQAPGLLFTKHFCRGVLIQGPISISVLVLFVSLCQNAMLILKLCCHSATAPFMNRLQNSA